MADFTVSSDIDTFLQSADNAAARVAIGADVRTDANGAFSAGDLGGNARGTNAINIQATRSSITRVASGAYSAAIGNDTTASGYYAATAIGNNATCSGSYSVAIGNFSTASAYFSTAISSGSTASAYYSTASGYNANASGTAAIAIGSYSAASGLYSTASGYSATASGYSATAIGYYPTASGNSSTAIGNNVKTTAANTTEIGYWSNDTTRAGAIRVHGTGMVSQTIQNRSTAYGDGGATKGSEADNTVIREGIALRRNGNEILVDLNIGGTVTTLSLGTAS